MYKLSPFIFLNQKRNPVFLTGAAQGFSSRRTNVYASDGNPGRTQRIGKKTVFERET
jgi:hypothetical protein